MKIWFIRHPETFTNREKRFPFDETPAALTQRGYRQAAALTRMFESVASNGMQPNMILSSPQLRSAMLARSAAEIFGTTDVRLSEALLRERLLGVWGGKLYNAIDWSPYEGTPLEEQRAEGGETFLQVRARIKLFFRQYQSYMTEDAWILVFTHAGVIRTLQWMFTDRTLEQLFSVPAYQPHNVGLWILEYNPANGTGRFVEENCTDHLRAYQ